MPEPADVPFERLAAVLSEEHRLLIALRDRLYNGQWATMLRDLNDRLAGRPFILKLATRIREDIERINAMRRLERHYGVNLADCPQLQAAGGPATRP